MDRSAVACKIFDLHVNGDFFILMIPKKKYGIFSRARTTTLRYLSPFVPTLGRRKSWVKFSPASMARGKSEEDPGRYLMAPSRQYFGLRHRQRNLWWRSPRSRWWERPTHAWTRAGRRRKRPTSRTTFRFGHEQFASVRKKYITYLSIYLCIVN